MKYLALYTRKFSLALTGAAIVCAAANTAIAKEDAFTRECALRDAAAVTWIEAQGNANAMPPALLAEATFTVLRARNACMHGKVAEALELYESAVSSREGVARQ